MSFYDSYPQYRPPPASTWGSTNSALMTASYGPSIQQSYAQNNRIARANLNAGSAWGGAISAGIQAVGDYFNTRAEVKAAEASQKRNLAAERYFNDMRRKNALEDKRFLEESAGIYRQLARPNLRNEPAPIMTDPSTIRPVNPYGGRG